MAVQWTLLLAVALLVLARFGTARATPTADIRAPPGVPALTRGSARATKSTTSAESDSALNTVSKRALQTSNPHALPQAELDVLWDLFTHLGGTSWRFQPDTAAYGAKWAVPDSSTAASWEALFAKQPEAADVCNWQGVQCTCQGHKHPFKAPFGEREFYYSDDSAAVPSAACSVSKLQLNGFGLKGPFPASLGNLPGLVVLQLAATDADKAAGTVLSGDFADTATLLKGKLRGLKKLHLTNQALAGGLPDWLFGCASLKSLWVDNNALTAPVSPYLGQLAALVSLRLDHNQISDFPLEVNAYPLTLPPNPIP